LVILNYTKTFTLDTYCSIKEVGVMLSQVEVIKIIVV
jgi:hypothetical protein